MIIILDNLLGKNIDEIMNIVTTYKQPPYRAKQIFSWLYKGIDSMDGMSNIPKHLIESLKKEYYIGRIDCIKKLRDNSDSTCKYLFALSDDNIIESVLLPYSHGFTTCISTQVGCNMACTFCASTIGGKIRDLTAGEMIDQILTIQKIEDIRVSNVVLMGSGEPLDNYYEVLKFLKLINDSNGINIGQRHITLSTCGLVPKIYKLADEKLQINLAISLHAADDEKRNKIMPISKRYTLEKLLKACKYYIDKTGRRVTFEYALIHNVNDDVISAQKLVNLLKTVHCHVNLIPLNLVKEREYKQSNFQSINKFNKYLNDHGINATIRREMGKEIDAACGQLRRDYINNK